MKITILKGLPASGKTTWAKEYCTQNKDWVRINRDDLRNMRGVYWIPKMEDMITKWENQLILKTLSAGYNVILDATNLSDDRNKARIKQLKVRFPDLLVTYKSFEVSVEECIKRDLKRANSVGAKVIRRMAAKYSPVEKVVYQEDATLPHAVIFDVDGTLAKMNGRTPYEWERVGEDLLNQPVFELYKMAKAAGKKIIIFTGRDGVCLPQTIKWLADNNITYTEIHIRPEGNQEKDSIIKKRIFEEEIRGIYFVDFVVDDRNQVIDMWRRELGLTCLQVDYGDF